jgi:hypothetical protein
MPDASGQLPAMTWVRSLDRASQLRLQAVCAAVDVQLSGGRSLASLARQVASSTSGLWQLLLTMPGYRGSHPSLLYWPAEMIFWGVAGSSTTRLTATQIIASDEFVHDWLRRTNDATCTTSKSG